MHWFIEELGALTAAENCCHTLHNTYTLRGAQIRDPQAWSQYLNETIDRWGDKTEVIYGMHHWPVWGNERVARHDQQGSRRLPLHQRPDPAARQPRLHAGRDRRDDRAAARARPATGRCAATTAPSTTTSRPPTSSTSAGSTATRRRSTRCRRRRRRSATSSSWAVPTRSSRRPARRSTRASTAGSPRSSTTSSSPTRQRRHGRCRPTRSSSSATSPRPARGATCT